MKYGTYLVSGACRLVKFCTMSFLFTLVLLSGYFIETGMPGNLLGLVYALSIPTYYYMIITAGTFLLLPLSFIRFARYLAITPKVFIDFYLLVNLFVFNIYRFHIDGMFINIAVHDFYGIGIPSYIIGLLIASFALILLVNALVFHKARDLKKWPARAFFGMVLLFAAGQSIHIWGKEYDQRYITRYTTCFPYYFPVKAGNFMGDLAHYFPSIVPVHLQEKNSGIGLGGENNVFALRYPLRNIECRKSAGESCNILFFIIESWRFDMMNEAVTPNIHKLAHKGFVFTNHMSGGSVTHTGLFSLMYGLHPTYMKFIETSPEKYPPLLMRMVKENGCDIRVYTSSNLEGFSLKKMFFHGIAPDNYTMRYDQDNVTNDRYVVSKLIESIKKDRGHAPFFTFVFLTSSHCGYAYPESHEIFLPTCRESTFLFNKYADPGPLLNRYRNSLHYVDSLFGEIVSALEHAGLEKRTVIVVTSDHGEEFNDRGNGYWGHGSDFTSYQSRVPLVLYLPDRAGGQVIRKRSSHIDVAPTLLKHLFRCANEVSDYSNGADLFNLPGRRGLIIRSYKSKAYVVDDIVYSEGIPLDSYYLNDMDRKNSKIDYREIRVLKESECVFLGRNTGRAVSTHLN